MIKKRHDIEEFGNENPIAKTIKKVVNGANFVDRE